ncbi:MAG: hypothetical protein NC906_02645 [Candidatus Omnitrophica bacterium]|nr:hypothetical protein [Candidatus Omnitrophota bacterium]
MIEINLLKTRQEKFYQKVLLIRILFIYVIGFIFLLIVLGISFLSNRIAIKSVMGAIEKYNQRIKEYQSVIKTLENYKSEIDTLARLLFLGQEEYKKRILWGKRFSIIVSSVPEGIAINKMLLSENTIGEKTQKVLIIEGSVMPGIENVSGVLTQFINGIKNNSSSEFSSVTLAEIKKSDKSAGTQGTLFKIECELK